MCTITPRPRCRCRAVRAFWSSGLLGRDRAPVLGVIPVARRVEPAFVRPKSGPQVVLAILCPPQYFPCRLRASSPLRCGVGARFDSLEGGAIQRVLDNALGRHTGNAKLFREEAATGEARVCLPLDFSTHFPDQVVRRRRLSCAAALSVRRHYSCGRLAGLDTRYDALGGAPLKGEVRSGFPTSAITLSAPGT